MAEDYDAEDPFLSDGSVSEQTQVIEAMPAIAPLDPGAQGAATSAWSDPTSARDAWTAQEVPAEDADGRSQTAGQDGDPIPSSAVVSVGNSAPTGIHAVQPQQEAGPPGEQHPQASSLVLGEAVPTPQEELASYACNAWAGVDECDDGPTASPPPPGEGTSRCDDWSDHGAESPGIEPVSGVAEAAGSPTAASADGGQEERQQCSRSSHTLDVSDSDDLDASAVIEYSDDGGNALPVGAAAGVVHVHGSPSHEPPAAEPGASATPAAAAQPWLGATRPVTAGADGRRRSGSIVGGDALGDTSRSSSSSSSSSSVSRSGGGGDSTEAAGGRGGSSAAPPCTPPARREEEAAACGSTAAGAQSLLQNAAGPQQAWPPPARGDTSGRSSNVGIDAHDASFASTAVDACADVAGEQAAEACAHAAAVAAAAVHGTAAAGASHVAEPHAAPPRRSQPSTASSASLSSLSDEGGPPGEGQRFGWAAAPALPPRPVTARSPQRRERAALKAPEAYQHGAEYDGSGSSPADQGWQRAPSSSSGSGSSVEMSQEWGVTQGREAWGWDQPGQAQLVQQGLHTTLSATHGATACSASPPPAAPDPATWTVREVCTFLEALGLGQYRQRFMHHCVDGRLLLRLDHSALKQELLVGPLGHRTLLLDALRALLGASHSSTPGEWRPSSSPGGAIASSRPIATSPSPKHRRPASAHSKVIPGDAYLGPAAGRMTVYEQRAKLLFELDRAQARVGAVSTSAVQAEHRARIARTEVARLRGLLQGLEEEHHTELEETGGGLDAKAMVPWRAIGTGTRARDPHPERLGRTWDPPEVELTFQPRISARSRELMSQARGADGGGATFLDRLARDAARRKANLHTLTVRHHHQRTGTSGAAAAARPGERAGAGDASLERDRRCIRRYCRARWGLDLQSLAPGGNANEADEELDQVLSQHASDMREQLGLREPPEQPGGEAVAADDAAAALGAGAAPSPPPLGARGGGRRRDELQRVAAARGAAKVEALAAVIRTLQFLERYKHDLKTRDERLAKLHAKIIREATRQDSQGKQVDPRAKELAQMAKAYADLGWGLTVDGEGPSPPRLEALLQRAVAYKAEWDKLKDAQRGAPGARRLPEHLTLDWSKAPFSSDGLDALMKRHQAAQASVAGARPPSASPAAGEAAGKAVAPAAPAGPWTDELAHCVRLMAACRADELAKLQRLPEEAQALAVFRAMRSQRFLEFTAADIAAHEAKLEAAWVALEERRRGRVVGAAELDAFYARMQEDGAKRKHALDAAKAEVAARALAALSGGGGRPARRPASATAAAAGARPATAGQR